MRLPQTEMLPPKYGAMIRAPNISTVMIQNPLTKATQTTTVLGRLTGFTGYSYLRTLKSGKSIIEAQDNEEVSRQNALLQMLNNLNYAVRSGICRNGIDSGRRLAGTQVASTIDSNYLPRHIFGGIRGQKKRQACHIRWVTYST